MHAHTKFVYEIVPGWTKCSFAILTRIWVANHPILHFLLMMFSLSQILAEREEAWICCGSRHAFPRSERSLCVAAQLVGRLQSSWIAAVVWNYGELSLRPSWDKQEQPWLHTKWENILLRTYQPTHTVMILNNRHLINDVAMVYKYSKTPSIINSFGSSPTLWMTGPLSFAHYISWLCRFKILI